MGAAVGETVVAAVQLGKCAAIRSRYEGDQRFTLAFGAEA